METPPNELFFIISRVAVVCPGNVVLDHVLIKVFPSDRIGVEIIIVKCFNAPYITEVSQFLFRYSSCGCT